ncbi:SET domain-containing protein [Fusarium heterosporum]|uniref:SET domain-containing protein n=1 Tax=Fusarium heterosporum TaxID=42747 RepID=A0A8H5TME8_FUSHE|nr:SET domain-containing protein [Fusarium heterosporum]
MAGLVGNGMIALREVPGKGKGLIATQKIPKGTRILSEKPVVTVPEYASDSPALRESIRKQVDALPSDQREAFLAMRNIYPKEATSQYLGIIRTNGLPMDSGSGIFLAACRINHACDNNAQKGWNKKTERHTVHALRDIDENEEITITYLGALYNRRTRHEALLDKFRFNCTCGLCSLPPHLSAESDRRLDEILELDRRIDRDIPTGILADPKRLLGYVDRQVRLYNEHGPDGVGLPRAFFDAAQITAANGDLARARVFFERAATGWTSQGNGDSPNVLSAKQFTQNPASYEMFEKSAAWRTSVEDIPSGLDVNEFEDWLWRRDMNNGSQQQGVFRNQAIFQSFLELPDESDVDEDFFQSRNGVNNQHRRHWCFLAEIVDFVTLVRLQMEVKDVAGNIVPLSFYTDKRGSEIQQSQIRKGYTIAVLYAKQHVFAFSPPGIRLENPVLVKVRTTTLLHGLSLESPLITLVPPIRYSLYH